MTRTHWSEKVGLRVEQHFSSRNLLGWCAVGILVLLAVAIIGLASGSTLIFGSCLALIITVITWAGAQHLAFSRIIWEAIRAYYDEGDKKAFVDSRRWLANEAAGDSTDSLKQEGLQCRQDAVSITSNYLEKWAGLVKKRYLPLWVFDGPSGAMAANMLRLTSKDIVARRTSGNHPNTRYSEKFVWLVDEIYRNDFLGCWPSESLEELRTSLKELLSTDEPWSS